MTRRCPPSAWAASARSPRRTCTASSARRRRRWPNSASARRRPPDAQRHRDRGCGGAASDRGRGIGVGRAGRGSHPVWPHQGQGGAGLHRGPGEPAGRRAGAGDRDQPDPCRRGQDHDHHRARGCAAPHRTARGDLPAGTIARAVLRREGGCYRRRHGPGGADGGDQPAFHGGFPRHHLGQQPARRDAGQPRLLGQRARHRHPPGQLAARAGHERPRTAQPRRGAWAARPTVRRARMGSTSPWRPR